MTQCVICRTSVENIFEIVSNQQLLFFIGNQNSTTSVAIQDQIEQIENKPISFGFGGCLFSPQMRIQKLLELGPA